MTQNEMILNHLRDHGSITPQEAMARYGCMRLSARIWDLKREGRAITVRRETARNRYGDKTTYARYSMAKEARA